MERIYSNESTVQVPVYSSMYHKERMTGTFTITRTGGGEGGGGYKILNHLCPIQVESSIPMGCTTKDIVVFRTGTLNVVLVLI